MLTSSEQTCARCGHTTPTCTSCGKGDPFLGGGVAGQDYCHTFSEGSPTCYMVASRLPVDPESEMLKALGESLIRLSDFDLSRFAEVDRPK